MTRTIMVETADGWEKKIVRGKNLKSIIAKAKALPDIEWEHQAHADRPGTCLRGFGRGDQSRILGAIILNC